MIYNNQTVSGRAKIAWPVAKRFPFRLHGRLPNTIGDGWRTWFGSNPLVGKIFMTIPTIVWIDVFYACMILAYTSTSNATTTTTTTHTTTTIWMRWYITISHGGWGGRTNDERMTNHRRQTNDKRANDKRTKDERTTNDKRKTNERTSDERTKNDKWTTNEERRTINKRKMNN